MDWGTVWLAVAVIVAALITALAALVYMSSRPAPILAPVVSNKVPPDAPDLVFLFDGDVLVDASDAAYRLLSITGTHGSDMLRLIALLSPRFPTLHDSVMAAKELDALDLVSEDGLSRLRVGVGGGRIRLTLDDLETDEAPLPGRHAFYALAEELETYRALEKGMPVPIWRQTEDAQVTWANAAYLELAARLGHKPGSGLLFPNLFDLAGRVASGNAQRVQIKVPEQAEPLWFDCHAAAVGSDFVFTAIAADRIVQAQRNLREFVQTLTQTFAHLSVGLAIFNKSRQLTLFNPALSDLLGCAPEYLIARPQLAQFLDQLRERQMMPEPKDYKSWRQQMSELEAAAADGSYSETWSLADGRTFRVTGRPHPDGAVAFLFEDISAEISLSRRFRSELETGQAVIDSLDEAVAVFSPAGFLMMSNRSYDLLWQCDPNATLGDISFLEATRTWQKRCAPTPVWGDARDFAATFGERSNWAAEVRLLDGRRLNCRFEALPGGVTLAAFAEPAGVALAPVTTDTGVVAPKIAVASRQGIAGVSR